MSTGRMITLIAAMAALSVGAAYALMTHQHTVAAQALQTHQASLKAVRSQLQELEASLRAARAAQAELSRRCQLGLQQAGLELSRRMEGLLVQQELRLIRTFCLARPSRPAARRRQSFARSRISACRLKTRHPGGGRRNWWRARRGWCREVSSEANQSANGAVRPDQWSRDPAVYCRGLGGSH